MSFFSRLFGKKEKVEPTTNVNTQNKSVNTNEVLKKDEVKDQAKTMPSFNSKGIMKFDNTELIENKTKLNELAQTKGDNLLIGVYGNQLACVKKSCKNGYEEVKKSAEKTMEYHRLNGQLV